MQIEWWVVLATLAGPVVAVQTQKWIERASHKRNRREAMFQVLMANRATRLADEHVKMLNLIDLEFRANRIPSRKDKTVREAWKSLFGELTRGLAPNESDVNLVNAWNQRCDNAYVVLISAFAACLNYDLSQEDLKRGIYYPRGHQERENAQLAILLRLKAILEGDAALPVTAIMTSEAVASQKALVDKIMGGYADDGSMKVKIVDEPK